MVGRKELRRRQRGLAYRPYKSFPASDGPRDVCPHASKQAQPEQQQPLKGPGCCPSTGVTLPYYRCQERE